LLCSNENCYSIITSENEDVESLEAQVIEIAKKEGWVVVETTDDEKGFITGTDIFCKECMNKDCVQLVERVKALFYEYV
jgi:hypothetical protein